MTSEATKEMVRRRTESGKCSALLWHGPGHQSRTFCEQEGVHDIHAAVYGSMRQYAEWMGEEAMTGFFDEPPEMEGAKETE